MLYRNSELRVETWQKKMCLSERKPNGRATMKEYYELPDQRIVDAINRQNTWAESRPVVMAT